MGGRLLDEQLDPEEVLRGTLVPELVSEPPKKMPVTVEWPAIFYKEPEQLFSFQIDGNAIYRHDIDIELTDPTEDGPLRFSLVSGAATATFEVRLTKNDGNLDCSVVSVDGVPATIRYRGGSMVYRAYSLCVSYPFYR